MIFIEMQLTSLTLQIITNLTPFRQWFLTFFSLTLFFFFLKNLRL